MAKTQSEDSGRNCTLPLWSLRFFSIRDWEPEVLRCNLILRPFLRYGLRQPATKTGATSRGFARTREAWEE